MKKTALFIGWNRPLAGREAAALEHFQSAMNYMGKLKGAGTIDSFEPVLLNTHGGDMNGFVLLRGDNDKLNALVDTDEWRDMILKSNILLQQHGVIRAFVGEELQSEMGRYGKILQQVR
jgi:hypothetical protein